MAAAVTVVEVRDDRVWTMAQSMRLEKKEDFKRYLGERRK